MARMGRKGFNPIKHTQKRKIMGNDLRNNVLITAINDKKLPTDLHRHFFITKAMFPKEIQICSRELSLVGLNNASGIGWGEGGNVIGGVAWPAHSKRQIMTRKTSQLPSTPRH